ncbi:restriction endonuclease subunit S [Campylobacter upsaliensis]|uniref:restriction endonuclease subunit S n=1 Tax=Campylobacter upsaliensis TaxID=28080 RepID=UPI0022EAFB75|nr:restriction endonuclease subunit S [Campylobacter upsaliensis]
MRGGGGGVKAHWEVKRLRHIFKEVSIKKCGNEQQLCATQSYGVIPKKLYSYKTVEVISSDLNSFKLVKKDNFVISLRSFEGGIEHSNYQGIISPAYTILEPQVEIYSFYFKFLFKSSFFISTLNIHKIGIREGQNISYASLQYTPIPLPPLQEQKEIAEFLDKKCEKIQNYINKKQKLITLLQEKKQALINEAVCGRVACHTERSEVSTTAYKPSGIEWLGEIPKHWEICKLNKISYFINGYAFESSHFDYSFSIPVIRIGDIQNDKIIYHTCLMTKEQENLKNFMIYRGDIVIALSGATTGKFAVCNSNKKAYINQRVAIIRSDIKILKYYLSTFGFANYIDMLCNGSAQPNISTKEVGNFKIPLPPLHEQKEIAEFLDSKVAQINSVIEKTKKQIELIKEYKNTLINEAICGRINLERK